MTRLILLSCYVLSVVLLHVCVKSHLNINCVRSCLHVAALYLPSVVDIMSLRLNLDGFSDVLAESISIYDFLTIRGISSGGAATSSPMSSCHRLGPCRLR